MKKNLLPLMLIFAALVSGTSCSDKDDDVVEMPKDKVATTHFKDNDGKEYTLFSTEITVAGTLKEILLKNHQEYEIQALKVSGRLNGTDLRFLRDMAGRDSLDHQTEGDLHYLDMSDALIVGGGMSYYEDYYAEENTVGAYLFYDCQEIETVKLPSTAKEIRRNAFADAHNLKSVTIGNSVTEIGSSAFDDCSDLTEVHISDIAAWCNIEFSSSSSNPLYYAHRLFLGDTEITSLEIPNSVTEIGNYAFYGCSGLTEVTIPNSVTEIGDDAFSGCSSLTEVTIPNSVTSIGDRAFYGCSGLTEVTIPNRVTSIGDAVFSGCSGLTEVTIPNSVTLIGERAFSGCSGLAEVTIGNSVTWIGELAFYRCNTLMRIHSKNTTPPTLSHYYYYYTFDEEAYDRTTVYVPKGCKTAYEKANEWNRFRNIIEE